jgi:hypothetical protein
LKLIYVLAVFIIVILTVFIPGTRVFSGLVSGAQDARLFEAAELIATTSNGLNSEGSIATIEVSIPAGRIILAPGEVMAEGKGRAKSYSADIENALTLEAGRHTLRLENTGGGVRVTKP